MYYVMDGILKTKLYRSLAEGRKDVELWEDNCPEDGWRLFSIVAFSRGEATILARIRMKDEQIQNSVRGENGEEAWVATE